MHYQILPVTPYQQNCSLVWCETSNIAALIDPGGESTRLISEVRQRNLTLEKVILTHGHLDHVGAANEIAQQFNIPIIGPHEADQFWFDWLPGQAEMFNFPPLEAFLPQQWVKEGDRITVGEIQFQVFHCPGHTPGHIVLYEPNNKLLFAGDVIFQGSIGRTDFPKGNHGELIESIRNKILSLDEDITIVPGHGPITTVGYEKLHNPFLQ